MPIDDKNRHIGDYQSYTAGAVHREGALVYQSRCAAGAGVRHHGDYPARANPQTHCPGGGEQPRRCGSSPVAEISGGANLGRLNYCGVNVAASHHGPIVDDADNGPAGQHRDTLAAGVQQVLSPVPRLTIRTSGVP